MVSLLGYDDYDSSSHEARASAFNPISSTIGSIWPVMRATLRGWRRRLLAHPAYTMYDRFHVILAKSIRSRTAFSFPNLVVRFGILFSVVFLRLRKNGVWIHPVTQQARPLSSFFF